MLHSEATAVARRVRWRKHLLNTDDPTAVPLAALLPRDAFKPGNR